MKRKVMLTGMAVMASMPGWAMAKGGGKPAAAAPAYAGGLYTPATVQSVAVDYTPPVVAGERPRSNAAELLAQIKGVLRSADYGAALKPAPSGTGWTLELLPNAGTAPGYGETRPGYAAPVGVALRYRF